MMLKVKLKLDPMIVWDGNEYKLRSLIKHIFGFDSEACEVMALHILERDQANNPVVIRMSQKMLRWSNTFVKKIFQPGEISLEVISELGEKE